MAINPVLGNELAARRATRNFSPEVLAKYTTDDAAPYHCNKVEGACQKEFNQPQSLITHVNRTHLDVVNPSRRKQGRNGAHKARKGKLECPECHLPFKRRATLTLHIRKVHGKSIKDFETQADYPCPFKRCKRAPLKSRAGLTRHLREMHAGKQPPVRKAEPITNGNGAHQIVLNNNGHSPARLQRIPKATPDVLWCPIPVEKVFNLVQHAINFAANS